MDKLTKDDIKVLAEALDAWISKDLAGDLMGLIIGSTIPKGEQRDKFDAHEREIRKENIARTENRKERATILKAKLYVMRDKLEVDEITK